MLTSKRPTRSSSRRKRGRGSALALLVLAACGRFPADPEETTERVGQTRVVRVGVTEHAPWVVRAAGDSETSGLEAEIVQQFASARGARVALRWGQQDVLLGALEHFELDLVIGGIDETTPWKDRIGMTDPWFELHESRLIIAVPPGENRWLGELERFLGPRRSELERRALEVAR